MAYSNGNECELMSNSRREFDKNLHFLWLNHYYKNRMTKNPRGQVLEAFKKNSQVSVFLNTIAQNFETNSRYGETVQIFRKCSC